jgi:hypothetical protein
VPPKTEQVEFNIGDDAFVINQSGKIVLTKDEAGVNWNEVWHALLAGATTQFKIIAQQGSDANSVDEEYTVDVIRSAIEKLEVKFGGVPYTLYDDAGNPIEFNPNILKYKCTVPRERKSVLIDVGNITQGYTVTGNGWQNLNAAAATTLEISVKKANQEINKNHVTVEKAPAMMIKNIKIGVGANLACRQLSVLKDKETVLLCTVPYPVDIIAINAVRNEAMCPTAAVCPIEYENPDYLKSYGRLSVGELAVGRNRVFIRMNRGNVTKDESKDKSKEKDNYSVTYELHIVREEEEGCSCCCCP